MPRKPVKHKKKVPGREKVQKPWFICKNLYGTDQDLYDEQPSEDYEEGYGLTVVLGDNDIDMRNIGRISAISNPYAFVIYRPEYNSELDKPFVLLYIIHKSKWEHDILAYKLQDPNCYFKQAYRLDACGHEKVWFHKNWKLGSYNPDMYATIENKGFWEKSLCFPKEIRIQRRKMLMTEAGCFTPNEKDPDQCISKYDSSKCQYCLLRPNHEKQTERRDRTINRKRRASFRAYKKRHPEKFANRKKP